MTKIHVGLLLLAVSMVAWGAAPKSNSAAAASKTSDFGTQALTPVPFPRFAEPVADGGADPVVHFNGLIYNDTRGCMQVTNPDGGARRWDCVATRSDIPPPFDAGTPPAATPGTQMVQSATAPALPAAQAAQNRGQVFFDTTQQCMRATRDGLAWGSCLNTEVCTTVPVSALSLPILGATGTFTGTIPGAIPGKPCSVGAPGGLLNVGVTFACTITAANTASFRFQGALGLSITGGNYTVCTEVLW